MFGNLPPEPINTQYNENPDAMRVPYRSFKMDIHSENTLHKARELLTRAGHYRSAQYVVEADHALTAASALCHQLSDTLGMSLHDHGVVDAVMQIWFAGKAVSDAAMKYLPGNALDDSRLEAIATLRADIEIEQNYWLHAAISYAYALLANRRRHGHPTWLTLTAENTASL